MLIIPLPEEFDREGRPSTHLTELLCATADLHGWTIHTCITAPLEVPSNPDTMERRELATKITNDNEVIELVIEQLRAIKVRNIIIY
jgi:hypothetical protein